MLTYYRSSLVDLFNKIHQIKDDPFKHADEFQKIQEILIRRITYIERRIQKNRSRIKGLKATLSSTENRLSKQDAFDTKQIIEILHSQIDDYQDLLIIFRWVGDALAFLLIDRWDIKPIGLKKETPGFISGKKGTKRERKIFRNASQKRGGFLLLLNDLTNCMRHGDITIFHETRKRALIEVKSKVRYDKKQIKQAENTQKILKYLVDDYTDFLYGMRGDFIRVASSSKGIFYINEVNEVLNNARSHGQYYLEVERGVYYFSVHNPTIEKVQKLFDMMLKDFVGEIVLSQIDKHAYNESMYYPLTLSIRNAENLFCLCTGETILGAALDIGVIQEKIETLGFISGFSPESDLMLTIKNSEVDDEATRKISISRHFFNRIFAEFMSADWLIRETIKNLTDKASGLFEDSLFATKQP